MQRLYIVTLVCLSFFLLPVGAHAFDPPIADFGSTLKLTGKAKVTEVINPLTIRLSDDRIIHLTGLDYPDIDFYEPGPLSVTAQTILDDFLKGQVVLIYQTPSPKAGRKNRMDHSIAHLVRQKDKIWAQGLILKLGLARTRTSQYNMELADQMMELENSARQKKLGLWEDERYKVLSPEQTKTQIDSYAIVEGKIISASMKRNKVYLNFGRNWKEDFTVAIASKDLRSFTKVHMDPKQWSGKEVRVRGWISDYYGPFMEINHPSRFELIFKDAESTNGDGSEADEAKTPNKRQMKSTSFNNLRE